MSVICPTVERMLSTDSAADRFGITVTHAEDGHALATATVVEDMANGHGIAHGGIVFSLADTAFACAANSLLEGVATADATIAYLAPAEVGETLLAEARVVTHQGRRVIVDVTVRSGTRTVALYRGNGRASPGRTP